MGQVQSEFPLAQSTGFAESEPRSGLLLPSMGLFPGLPSLLKDTTTLSVSFKFCLKLGFYLYYHIALALFC
jgi:hypothetical protein